MIFAYNKEQVGDVLLVILEDTKDIKRSVERKGKVARVTADETGKTLAWNIFEASSLIDINGNGQVFLSDQDVAVLNEELAKEGFEERLENTQGPVFVVGQIDEMARKIISRRDRVVSCAILWRDTRQNCLNPELRLIPMAFCHFQMRQR